MISFVIFATKFQTANYDSDYVLTVGTHSLDKFFNDLDSMLEQGRRKVWNFEGAHIFSGSSVPTKIDRAQLPIHKNIEGGAHMPLCPPVPTAL